MDNTQKNTPTLQFEVDPASTIFEANTEKYLTEHNSTDLPFKYIATGSIVLDASTTPRVLLVQRSLHDSLPGLWEVPGGGCDPEDPSILYGAARELFEETGLIAKKVGPAIGEGQWFLSRSGNAIRRFNFIIDIDAKEGDVEVKLDPNEHQSFLWATEREMLAGRVGNVEVTFTHKDVPQILEKAFRIKREQISL